MFKIVIIIMLFNTTILAASDTVIWSNSMDDKTNWNTSVYYGSSYVTPYQGSECFRFFISAGSTATYPRKDTTALLPGLDWSGADEIEYWIYLTNYDTANIGDNIQNRIYYESGSYNYLTEVCYISNIELKKWRLISFATDGSGSAISKVSNIGWRFRRTGTSGKFAIFLDYLKVGKIAPIFVNSFSANPINGSTLSVTNLDSSNNYTNGATIHLRIDVGEIQFPNTITADFSAADSGFNSANVVITTNKYRDYINGVYDINYTISSGNSIWGKDKVIKIMATDRFGNGPTTNSTFKLNIWTGTPTRPLLISPANSSSILTLTPDFKWTSSTNSDSYQIEVSSKIDFSTLILSTNISATNYTINSGKLTEETTYYWRVRSKNYFYTGEWSSTNDFTTPQKVLFSTNITVNYFTNVQVSDSHNSIFYFPSQCYSESENITITIDEININETGFIRGYYLKPENITFDKYITIKFYITEADLPTGKSINDVVIRYYSGGDWITLKSSVEGNYVVIQTKTAGKFGAYIGTEVTEDLKIVKLSSKVFSPNGDGNNDILRFNIESKITPSDIKIYIYDIYGNLIKELSGDNPSWSGDSYIGVLKKGLYLYKIEAGTETARGSFIVIK